MTTVLQPAQAGTIESGDIMVTLAPGAAAGGIIIDLDSIVLAQYGEAIRRTLAATVQEAGIDNVYIRAVDRGALDCTIRARTIAALSRAGVQLKEAGEK